MFDAVRVDQAWLNQYEAKRNASKQTPTKSTGSESELHAQIIEECKRRGWIPLHGSMAHRTFRTEGEFDFTILGDSGRVFFVECKVGGNKLSDAQRDLHHWAKKLGHNPHVVWNFQQFMDIIK